MENRGGSITLFVCVRLCVFGVGVEKGFYFDISGIFQSNANMHTRKIRLR